MKEYHILSLSGGKDSTALAFFMKENMPEIFEKLELGFCDTEKEIPETYDYLNKIEIFLGKNINRLKPYKNFDHLYATLNILPSVNRRWCTVMLKTQTFRRYVYQLFKEHGEGIVYLYIGIRADEAHRALSSPTDDNFIKEVHPLIENNIYRKDVDNILNSSGIGYPDYYKWRKRSGCYFCFYQSKMDWINLYENHPDLYQKAMEYEFEAGDGIKKGRFGWNVDMPLKEIIKPENIKIIKENYQKLLDKKKKMAQSKKDGSFNSLLEIEDFEENQCKFCHL